MKGSDRMTQEQMPKGQEKKGDVDLCWKELLDSSIGGWTPADMALEHLIDRVEARS